MRQEVQFVAETAAGIVVVVEDRVEVDNLQIVVVVENRLADALVAAFGVAEDTAAAAAPMGDLLAEQNGQGRKQGKAPP